MSAQGRTRLALLALVAIQANAGNHGWQKQLTPVKYVVKHVPKPVAIPNPVHVPHYVPVPKFIPVFKPWAYAKPVPRHYTVYQKHNIPVPVPMFKFYNHHTSIPIPKPVPMPIPIKVPRPVIVPVPRPIYQKKEVPYPVHVPVPKPVVVPVYKHVPVPIPKPVHKIVKVVKEIPVYIKRPVPVYIDDKHGGAHGGHGSYHGGYGAHGSAWQAVASSGSETGGIEGGHASSSAAAAAAALAAHLSSQGIQVSFANDIGGSQITSPHAAGTSNLSKYFANGFGGAASGSISKAKTIRPTISDTDGASAHSLAAAAAAAVAALNSGSLSSHSASKSHGSAFGGLGEDIGGNAPQAHSNPEAALAVIAHAARQGAHSNIHEGNVRASTSADTNNEIGSWAAATSNFQSIHQVDPERPSWSSALTTSSNNYQNYFTPQNFDFSNRYRSGSGMTMPSASVLPGTPLNGAKKPTGQYQVVAQVDIDLSEKDKHSEHTQTQYDMLTSAILN